MIPNFFPIPLYIVYKSTNGTWASAYSFASASASECGLQPAGGQVTGHGGATLISTFDNIEIKSGEEGHGSSCFKWNKMSPRDSSTEDLLN